MTAARRAFECRHRRPGSGPCRRCGPSGISTAASCVASRSGRQARYALLARRRRLQSRWGSHRLRDERLTYRQLRAARRRVGRPAARAGRGARRSRRHAARQRHGVSGRPVRRPAARRHRRARSASASRRRASPTCSPTAAPRCSSTKRPGRAAAGHLGDAAARSIASPLSPDAPRGGLEQLDGDQRIAAPPPAGGRRGGHRGHPLHVRHHRAAQGGDADASRHLPLGHALRMLHGPHVRAIGPSSPCR